MKTRTVLRIAFIVFGGLLGYSINSAAQQSSCQPPRENNIRLRTPLSLCEKVELSRLVFVASVVDLELLNREGFPADAVVDGVVQPARIILSVRIEKSLLDRNDVALPEVVRIMNPTDGPWRGALSPQRYLPGSRYIFFVYGPINIQYRREGKEVTERGFFRYPGRSAARALPEAIANLDAVLSEIAEGRPPLLIPPFAPRYR